MYPKHRIHASHDPRKTRVEVFPFEEVNEVLETLRAGRLTGAAVLVP